MRSWGGVIAVSLVTAAASLGTAYCEIVRPFESEAEAPRRALDELVLKALEEKGIKPAPLCSDAVFIRRVYLDVIGTLPTAAEVSKFLADKDPKKRAKLIDALFERDEFADYWAMKWCDLLRVKAEFPINLWPNAVQAYHRWIREALRANMPYHQFAREMLTASGSNFREPQVNFYRAVQGKDTGVLAGAVALTFMGTRIDKWPDMQRKEMEAFFSRIKFKGTAEWKEEVVTFDHSATGPLKAVFPDGSDVMIQPGEDPRVVFANWLIRRNNPWFARNVVNRVWSWLMGRGIIHEPDDIRSDNPPSNPALLKYLEDMVVNADYDLRYLFREILNSRTYQQSSIPRSDYPEAGKLFAYYPVRRMEAEVLIDALCRITGTQESYFSMIPEPFTWVPESRRSIMLADGSITSQFLEMFGRPPRDTGLEAERSNKASDKQRLHLINSTHVQKKIRDSKPLRTIFSENAKNPRRLVDQIYLTVLSRPVTEKEWKTIRKYRESSGLDVRSAAQDLVWALINSKEFLHRH